jgi:hypothetical protein
LVTHPPRDPKIKGSAEELNRPFTTHRASFKSTGQYVTFQRMASSSHTLARSRKQLVDLSCASDFLQMI